MKQDEVVVLRRFLTRVDAELAKGALEAAHIHASVSADDSGGLYPGAGIGGIRLFVRAEDVHQASDVIGLTGKPLA